MTETERQSVPLELRDLPQWVIWRNIVRDGGPTKVPLTADHQAAKSNDPKTWTRFDVAHGSLADEDSGVGFMFSADDPYCGVDLDGCRDAESGVIADWAREIIIGFGSYAEVSPSGTGVKLWVRGSWNASGHKAMVDSPNTTGKAAAIECYDKLRYFAVTGRRLAGMLDIVEAQAGLDALAEKYWQAAPTPALNDWRSSTAVVERARKYIAHIPPAVSGQGGHNATYHVACVLVHGFELSESEAYDVLAEWNGCCQPPWSEKELRHKLQSATKASGPRGYLRNAAPQNYARITVPTYEEPVTKIVTPTTLREAAEKYLNVVRGGHNVLVPTGIPDLDHAIGGGAEFGEMFVLAGRPSHGKSAIALQMAHHWTNEGMPCAFLSEEMAAIVLGKRTIQFVTAVHEEQWAYQIGVVEQDVNQHFSARAECYILERCLSAETAVASIRHVVAEFNVRCVVVDYAQLLSSPGRGRFEQVTNTSIALRRAASETNVLLVALCQLNRAIEERKNFIPIMSDLKDTGQLEQDADVIVFGVWPHRVDPSKDPFEYQFWIAKNRNRATNAASFQVRFEPSRQRFLDAPVATNWHPSVEVPSDAVPF